MHKKRAILTTAERANASARVNQQLRELEFENQWNSIAAYLATDEELNVDDFLSWLLARGKSIYVPRGDDFAALIKWETIQKGRFGVREPQNAGIAGITEWEKLVFLVPGLAFDQCGGRLGFGGGWYDRALARFPQAFKIGVAFDFQIVNNVPREAHDVLMDAIITPSAFMNCKLQD
jgi:5-formyltetrahydrofolate cyclo-ligase